MLTAARLAILPNGLRLNLDNVTYYGNYDLGTNSFTNTVNFYFGGSSISYTCPTLSNANSLVSSIDSAMYNFGSIPTVLTYSNIAITGIGAPFNVTTDTVVIYGIGFTAGNIAGATGWIEDGEYPANEDSNGISLTLTYVSPTQVTGVLINKGDNNVSATQKYRLYIQFGDGSHSQGLVLSSTDNNTFS